MRPWRKRGADRLDFDVAFNRWLVNDDVLVSASATIDGTGSAAIDAIEVYLEFVRVWISGGANGEKYAVEVTGVTKHGRTKKQGFQLQIRDRN